MDLKPVVISGEASESDDDGDVVRCRANVRENSENFYGTIFSGEAPESDDEGASLGEDFMVDALTCIPYTELMDSKTIKYNSLLHKKLQECNETLDRDLTQMAEETVSTAIQELSAVNKQLLESEVVLQEAVCQLRNVNARAKDAWTALKQVVDINFLRSIKT